MSYAPRRVRLSGGAMSDFDFYSGTEFLAKQFESREYLIDQFLHEKDSVILAGKAKTGKSVLLFQLICALTSGKPFLGQYAVRKPCRVLYVQLEGSLDDSQDRFKRMMLNPDTQLNPENFFIYFSAPLALNDETQMLKLITWIVAEMWTVDVIIIDPIYFAMQGSLSDDDAVRRFTGQLRNLQDRFKCAIILAHHFKKARRDAEGNICATDDDDVFGSVFFQAWITHQFMFDKDKTSGARLLQCNIQRSGKIAEKLSMDMIEPEPLYFKVLNNFPTKGICLSTFFRQNPGRHKASNIRRTLSMAKTTFYAQAQELIKENKIAREYEDGEYVYFACIP